MMYRLLRVLAVPVLFIAGCQSGNPDGEAGSAARRPLIFELYSSAYCNAADKQSRLIALRNRHEIDVVTQRLSSHMFGSTISMDKHDPASQNLYLLDMGARPSAGYALDIVHDKLRLDGDTLVVHVLWTTPEQGTLAAQVITSPCVMFALGKGEYRHLNVVDQAGDIRARLQID